MKVSKTVRNFLCAVAVLAMVFALTACGEKDVAVISPTTTTNNNAIETTTSVTNQTTTQIQAEEQDMCYWCGELPVDEFEAYCVNCRCVKCDNLRKDGGGRYIYCPDHNCNENNCEEPAVEDSQYCVLHKCNDPSCSNEKWADSEYCYVHGG